MNTDLLIQYINDGNSISQLEKLFEYKYTQKFIRKITYQIGLKNKLHENGIKYKSDTLTKMKLDRYAKFDLLYLDDIKKYIDSGNTIVQITKLLDNKICRITLYRYLVYKNLMDNIKKTNLSNLSKRAVINGRWQWK